MSGSKRARQETSAGIEVRHARSCHSDEAEQGTCTPSFRAVAWSHRDQRLVRKAFTTEAAARLWREDARVDLRRGMMVAPRPTKLQEIGDAWLSAALGGGIRNRSGDRYKPSTLRGYEQALREYVYPELGSAKLQDVSAGDVQRLVDRLVARGLNPSTVRNALLPLRSICRRAVRQGDISANPTAGVELPAVRGRRTRIVTPVEALTLINNAPPEDRPLWATAFYAGLRRGELDHGHPRPLRPLIPRLRGAGCAPARHLPEGRPRARTHGGNRPVWEKCGKKHPRKRRF